MRAVPAASQARSPTTAIAMPGAAIHAFWLALSTRSMPHASISNGMAPRPLMPSTTTSGSPGAARTTAASSRSGFVTPVEVSLWVRRTARYGGFAARWAARAAGVGGLAPGDLEPLDVGAERLGDGCEPVAERPDRHGEHAVARATGC